MTEIANILVPTDFTSTGGAAVEFAFRMFSGRHVRVHLLHVCEPLATLEGPIGIEMTAIDRAERAAHARLEELAVAHRATEAQVDCSIEVGPAADEIVRCAQRLKADLIVMGTHGRRGFRRALLGSVAETVLRNAHCPVLVVRPPTHESAPRE